MLKMHNIRKSYRTDTIETHALRDFSLVVNEGEFVSVTGPSGSGKTTFLNIAGLLETPTGGEYLLDGQEVGGLSDRERSHLRNEKIGFIFQGFNLIPDLNLFDNIDVPLRYRGFNAKERRRRIEKSLEQVGLSARAKHLPAQLSGGQQQRVAIARALAMQPQIMFFDEPTSALDPEMIGEVLDVMRAMAREGMTMMIVSHEMGFIREAADRILFLDGGLIVEEGTPDQIFSDSQHPRTQEFLSRIL